MTLGREVRSLWRDMWGLLALFAALVVVLGAALGLGGTLFLHFPFLLLALMAWKGGAFVLSLVLVFLLLISLRAVL